MISYIKNYLGIQEVKGPLQRLLPYVRKYWLLYTGLSFFLLFGVFYTLFFAWFLKEFADLIVEGDYTGIGWLFTLAVIVTAVNIACAYFEVFTEYQAVDRITRDLKNDVFNHMLKLPTLYFIKEHSGDNVSKLTNDIYRIDGAIGKNLINLIKLPVTAAAAFLFLAFMNWKLALICFLAAPIAIGLGAVYGKKMRSNGRIIQQQFGKVNSFLHDTFAGHMIVRAFHLEKDMSRQNKRYNDEMFDLEKKDTRLQSKLHAGTGAVNGISYLLCLGIGAWFMNADSQFTIGTLLAFVVLFQNVISPISGLAFQWGGFQRSLAAADRVCAVLDEPPLFDELPEPRSVPGLRQGIHIEGLSFGYDPAEPLFESLSLDIRSGKVTALVGPSGAGKSTLFHLIMGLYGPWQGTISLDGVTTKNMDPALLLSHISVVPQETYLFTGTVKDNIALGKAGVSELDIIRVCKEANIHDYIMTLPQGYDSMVGERGVRLSGGQKQRIAIARAILKDSPVLLLDEATSALDSETEHAVKEALDRLMEGRTTIVIAHRLSTIRHADQIVVMDKGKIVEQGNHNQLIQRKGLYSRLYRKQFEDVEAM